jgi:hypothetical protein
MRIAPSDGLKLFAAAVPPLGFFAVLPETAAEQPGVAVLSFAELSAPRIPAGIKISLADNLLQKTAKTARTSRGSSGTVHRI